MEWNKLLSTKRVGQTSEDLETGLLPDSESTSTSSDPYLRKLIATDYVADMTDSCAIFRYQRISGIDLP